MKHLGDVTKISGYTAPVVDCIIGGSPCQDLSVAGQRAGLAGARSGLFMEQVRIVKEMRERDRASGRTGNAIRPRYLVWENVPGAFSSNRGGDFKAVLEEVIRIAEPEAPDVPLPPKGKWPLADAYCGDGWSVAYRVFDAQFWGVPQRRRRICLVADFGGHTAPEILFERESLCGYPQEGGEAREAAAGGPGPGVGAAIVLRMRAGCEGGGKGALVQVEKSGTLGTGNDQTIFCIQGNIVDRDVKQNGAGVMQDVSYTLDAVDRHAVAQPLVMGTGQARAEILQGLSPTLNCDHEQPIICLNDQGGAVMEVSVDKTGTLRAQEHGHQPLVFDARGNGDGKVAPTMTGDHESRVTDYSAVVMAFNPNQSEKAKGLGIAEEQAPTLGAEMHTPAVMIAAVDCRNGTLDPAVNGTLQAKESGGISLNCNNVVITPEGEPPPATFQNTGQGWWNEGEIGATLRTPTGGDAVKANLVATGMVVRRLTPLECERLQGFPDGWTDIGPWVDSKGKLHKESSDSARYKACGNSIALPPWKWVLKRLCAFGYERDATMASLFDGIGGFPLIWEQLNGKGSCLWASEIEEFPIAVTKFHFGEA